MRFLKGMFIFMCFSVILFGQDLSLSDSVVILPENVYTLPQSQFIHRCYGFEKGDIRIIGFSEEGLFAYLYIQSHDSHNSIELVIVNLINDEVLQDYEYQYGNDIDGILRQYFIEGNDKAAQYVWDDQLTTISDTLSEYGIRQITNFTVNELPTEINGDVLDIEIRSNEVFAISELNGEKRIATLIDDEIVEKYPPHSPGFGDPYINDEYPPEILGVLSSPFESRGVIFIKLSRDNWGQTIIPVGCHYELGFQ